MVCLPSSALACNTFTKLCRYSSVSKGRLNRITFLSTADDIPKPDCKTAFSIGSIYDVSQGCITIWFGSGQEIAANCFKVNLLPKQSTGRSSTSDGLALEVLILSIWLSKNANDFSNSGRTLSINSLYNM